MIKLCKNCKYADVDRYAPPCRECDIDHSLWEPKEEPVEERKWTEKEIREAVDTVSTKLNARTDSAYETLSMAVISVLKKHNQDPMDNPVFKKIMAKTPMNLKHYGEEYVSVKDLAKACQGERLMPEELSKEDMEYLKSIDRNDIRTAYLTDDEINTVNAWLKAKHEGKA